VDAAPPAVDRRALLTQCRVAVEKRLSADLEALLARLVPKIEALHHAAKERDERDQYANALSRLHGGRDAVLDRFRKEFSVRFAECVETLQRGFDPFGGEPSRAELAAMRTNVLEGEVAIGKLAALIKQAAAPELAELSARFATLFRRSLVDDGDNPLGPLVIARGVYAGVGALELQGRATRAVRDELEQQFVAPIAALYKGVNGAFASNGVAPAQPPAGAARAAPRAAPAVPTAAAPAQPASLPAASVSAAERALASAMEGAEIPMLLEVFLRETWSELLARAHAAGGYDGAAWSEAAKTMQELVWSLKPKQLPAERAQLVALLPGLLKRVSVGMEAAGMAPDGRSAVLDELMARHREILHPGDKPRPA
jgi:hypothetical protein